MSPFHEICLHLKFSFLQIKLFIHHQKSLNIQILPFIRLSSVPKNKELSRENLHVVIGKCISREVKKTTRDASKFVTQRKSQEALGNNHLMSNLRIKIFCLELVRY